MKWAVQTRRMLWGLVIAAIWRQARAADSGGEPEYPLVLRGGVVIDGTGAPARRADVAVAADRIVAIGDLGAARGRTELDASGLVVAPGFINSLSWATESIIEDPRAESDVRQGVTLEVFGEGLSMGPLNPAMKADLRCRQGQRRYPVDWNTLGEYLEFLEKRGVATNVASLVGATTVRVHELGHAGRAPTPRELGRMQDLVSTAMREGALGVGSALIYAPAAFAAPEELRALACAAAAHGGGYFSHLRSESGRLLEAVDELLGVARATRQHASIYHLKAAGREAWPLLDAAIARIESAQAEGLDVGANMYPYVAAASGLDATMPPWVQEGGQEEWLRRLRDPAVRASVVAEIDAPGGWESLYAAAGSAAGVRLLGFRTPALRHLTGRTLEAVARERGCSPAEAIVDLVLADESRVNAAYFMMSEENVRRQLALPWVTLCSDEEALAPRGGFLRQAPHPRAYGAFARFLGHYVRDLGLLSLEEAIRRITSLPARNFRLADRGVLRPGACADVVAFDPARVQDLATYDDPHRFAAGMVHVVVNGQPVLRDGRMTDARPGRFVRGPGWRGEALAGAPLSRAAG